MLTSEILLSYKIENISHQLPRHIGIQQQRQGNTFWEVERKLKERNFLKHKVG